MELAARVEAASGADRELDFWISVRIAGTRHADAELQADINLVGIEGMLIDAPYTASIDAALSLVPTGVGDDPLSIMIKRSYRNDASVLLLDSLTGRQWHGDGNSIALALCAAALRASAPFSVRCEQEGGVG